jgi:hypothetical protein
MYALALVLPCCSHGEAYGGLRPLANPASNCITPSQQREVEEKLKEFAASHPEITASLIPLPQQYRFQPIAGTLWQDRHILNFYDVDFSPGILDWDCSQFTYNNHNATDILIRGFGEQDAGVPLFAVLDGVVALAHDGENDRNRTLEGQPANYVILNHGGTHYSWYWHLRKGSVAVTVGQPVTAGTQIGQVGSSGHSEAPHVHFQSEFQGGTYETYSGPCYPGPRHWLVQLPIPRYTWISDFAMHDRLSIASTQFYPHDPPRAGTFVRTGLPQPIGAWYVIHNEQPNTVWRARYLRPNGTVGFDPGPRSRSNPFNRYAAWWFAFSFDPDTAGTWTMELTVNGVVILNAPFLVLNVGSTPANRPPRTPSAVVFDPSTPDARDPLFCRLTVSSPQDLDYDLVSYEYHWLINGLSYRKVTNAAFADAIPRAVVSANDSVTCVVTPYDGRQFGTPIMAQLNSASPAIRIRRLDQNRVELSWPTSSINYVLQTRSNLNPSSTWTTTAPPTRIGSRMFATNTIVGPARFYRLQWP